MDISSSQPLGPAANVNGVGAAYKATTSATPPAATGGGSSSQVSSEAQNLSQLAKLAQQAPDVRQDKVDQLKSQVDSGQYKVDLDKLADHLSNIL